MNRCNLMVIKELIPKTEAERYDYGRKRLKYLVLGRFVDLQDERESKPNIQRAKDSAWKPDSTLNGKPGK